MGLNAEAGRGLGISWYWYVCRSNNQKEQAFRRNVTVNLTRSDSSLRHSIFLFKNFIHFGGDESVAETWIYAEWIRSWLDVWAISFLRQYSYCVELSRGPRPRPLLRSFVDIEMMNRRKKTYLLMKRIHSRTLTVSGTERANNNHVSKLWCGIQLSDTIIWYYSRPSGSDKI